MKLAKLAKQTQKKMKIVDLSKSAALGFIAEAMLTGIFVGGGILTAAYMPAGSVFLRRLWLLQAPRITLAHRCLAAAASLGCAFVVTHIRVRRRGLGSHCMDSRFIRTFCRIHVHVRLPQEFKYAQCGI